MPKTAVKEMSPRELLSAVDRSDPHVAALVRLVETQQAEIEHQKIIIERATGDVSRLLGDLTAKAST